MKATQRNTLCSIVQYCEPACNLSLMRAKWEWNGVWHGTYSISQNGMETEMSLFLCLVLYLPKVHEYWYD